MAGVGDHPQPAADRPRRRGPAPAVARVHAAGRRHHRPPRPAPADGRGQPAALRAHRRGRRSPCSPARTSLPAPGRARAGRRHRRRCSTSCSSLATLLLGIGEVLYDNSAQTFLPAIVATERPRAGQRADVLGRDGRQPVPRPAAGQPAAGRRVRPAVRPRRRHVRRRRPGWSFVDRRRPARAAAATVRSTRKPWRAEAGRGVPLAVAPPGCCARWRIIARRCSTCSSNVTFAVFVLYAQEVLGTSTIEFAAARRGAGRRRRARRAGRRRRSPAASAPGPSLGLTLWSAAC